jgi:hypothetical protein
MSNKRVNVKNYAIGTESVRIMTRYEISAFAYNFAKCFAENCCRYRDLCNKAKDTQEKAGHLLNEMQNSVACFVFCEICLEAYINTYAGDSHKIPQWKKLERKLCLKDKWTEVPQLILNKTFETGKEPYKSLKWLVEKRNFIVHYKGEFNEPEMNERLGTLTDRIFNQFTLEEAERAFQLVKDMIKSLHRLDNSKVPDWLI